MIRMFLGLIIRVVRDHAVLLAEVPVEALAVAVVEIKRTGRHLLLHARPI